MTNRTPGAPATPVAAAPGVTNPTRKSPRGILQNRGRAHASQSGRPAVRRPGPRTPQNLTSRGHLKRGVCPSALTNLTEDRAGRETCFATYPGHVPATLDRTKTTHRNRVPGGAFQTGRAGPPGVPEFFWDPGRCFYAPQCPGKVRRW